MGNRTREALTDFAELVAKAFFGGLGVAIALSVAILALSSSAQAAHPVSPNDAKTGTLLLRSAADGEFVMAPKVSTEVGIEVVGMVARTRVTQVFHNPGTQFVEGVYVFPLPEQAAVDHLWMRIGERVIEGLVQEKAEARRIFERAKSEGRKAALVEQQRPDLFTNTVAHIGPDERVEIRIEYQQALACDNGEYRLRFPLAVTPRYPTPMKLRDPMPDEPKAREALAAGEGTLLHPAYFPAGPGNPVDIAVTIDAGMPVQDVRSSYHEASIDGRAANATTVVLVKDQEEADRDFELKWRIAGNAPQAAMFLDRGGDSDYALLMVVPPQPDAAQVQSAKRMPRETILIVDTSGSMEGASILQAKAWVQALRARGGTEMEPALEFALNGRDTPGYLRQVIFITDGAVGNEEALFRLIAGRLGSSRLFTVGIGSAPNSHFMAKAAQFGRGTFTYIGDVREVSAKMGALFAKIEAPVLRDVSIRWPDGTPVETFPARVPDLHLGEPVPVAAAAKAPLGTVVVSGLRGNEPWSVALAPPVDGHNPGVGALWARLKIARCCRNPIPRPRCSC